MAKSTTRTPRTPVNEDALVTIANQDRQIKNLIERVTTLAKERDDALKQCRMLGDEILSHRAAGEALCEQIDKLKGAIAAASSTNQRMLGWQDCAREVFSEMKIST